jgi:hypothetical protein
VDAEGTVSFRRSMSPEMDTAIDSYVKFVHRYTSSLMGSRKLNAYFKIFPNATIFDAINPSDEAFAILVIRNNYKLWRKQFRKQAKDDHFLRGRGDPPDTGSDLDSDDDDNLQAQVSTTGNDEEQEGPMFTGCKTRTKNKYLQSGWSNEGKEFYKKALIAFSIRNREKSGPYEDIRMVWMEKYGNDCNGGTDNEILPSPQTEEEQCAPRVAAKMSLDGEIDVNAITQMDFL